MGNHGEYLFIFVSLVLLFLQCDEVDCSSKLQKICQPSESFALLEFKKNVYPVERQSPKMETWLKEVDCCLWEGITCDTSTGHVIGLNLSSSYLEGSISTNSTLFLLSRLQTLDLSNNGFEAAILSEFLLLKNLSHLNLSYNLFFDQIPPQLSQLSNLVSLDLSYNPWLDVSSQSFETLSENLTSLLYLDLSKVNMSLVSPKTLLSLSTSLKSLRLRDCHLRGRLPTQLSSFKSLEVLDLSLNSGVIINISEVEFPATLRLLDLHEMSISGELRFRTGNNHLKSLEYFDASSNNFSGLLPSSSLANLNSLEHLDLSFNAFSGSVPPSFGNLNQLQFFNLRNNHFTGQIPDTFSNLTKLKILHLSFNNFSGEFPLSVFSLQNLRSLDVSSNQIMGSLPATGVSLPNLRRMELSFNMLGGKIPSWLFGLPSLKNLLLVHNNLNGSIDQQLHGLPRISPLEKVDLSQNYIHGPIPSFISDLVNLRFLNLSRNAFSGIVQWSFLQKLKSLEQLDLSKNSELSFTSSTNFNISLPNLILLALSSCNVTEFPSFLGGVEKLSYLDLSNNGIAGKITHFTSDAWPSLAFLNLSSNLLTSLDQIPGSNVDTLDLSFNLLKGRLPNPPWGTKFFFISNNQLSGEVPSSFCNSGGFLKVLDVSDNNLGPLLPHCLGFLEDLQILNLRNNKFIGRVADLFSDECSLVYLNMKGNQFEGPIPKSIANCVNLQVLDLGNNKISDTFPHWLEALPKLQILSLKSNHFHGVISDPDVTTSSFPKLRIIDLSHNNFSGLVPKKLVKNLKSMTNTNDAKDESKYVKIDVIYHDTLVLELTIKGSNIEMQKILSIFTTVDFSNNQFQGEIPGEIGMLKSLVLLNFSHNSLTGNIPLSFANLTQVESIDLSSNRLEGEIPAVLTDLTFLAVLNLSYNQLKGSIPQGRQFNTFSNDSYIGNLKLCGFPLSHGCKDSDQPTPMPTGDEEDDLTRMFEWKTAMMGYGSGLVIGLSVGYIVFTIRRPSWFVRIVEEKGHKRVRRRRGGRRYR